MAQFTGLNENEVKVLVTIRLAIENETGTQYCYSDDIPVENLSVHQVAGYLSALLEKDRIYIDDGFDQVYMVDVDGNVIDDIEDDEWRW